MKTNHQITQYINQTLGHKIKLKELKTANKLPLYLREQFSFFEGLLEKNKIIFAIDNHEKEYTPAIIQNRVEQIQKKYPQPIIYVREKITAYNRQRLIKYKIPFIVPNAQMYLPPLGIDLREHFNKLKNTPKHLSPASQVIMLCILLNDDDKKVFSLKELAHEFSMTRMTMSRSFDEIEVLQIVHCVVEKKERQLIVEVPKKELWQKSLPYLRNPVKKSLFANLKRKNFGIVSGFSALSQYSMLADPLNPVVAMTDIELKALREKNLIIEQPYAEPESTQIEIWRYDPTLFSQKGIADKFSILLTLKDEIDERVEMALQEMMEGIKW